MTMVVMTVLIDDPAEYQIMICLMTVVFRIILTKIKKLAMRSMMVPHADHYHRQHHKQRRGPSSKHQKHESAPFSFEPMGIVFIISVFRIRLGAPSAICDV